MYLCILRVLGVCHSMFIARESLHKSLYFHHVIVVLEAYLLHFIIFVFVALRCNLELVGILILLIPSGAVGKDCQRRLLSRPKVRQSL
jgi:hypothetical protein